MVSARYITVLPDQPGWTDTIELLERGREFSTTLGVVQVIDSEGWAVELVQGEYIDYDTRPAVVRRAAPELRINGYRFSLGHAGDLVRLVQAALDLERD